MMSCYHTSALTLTSSQNGTGAIEANLFMNQDRASLARVLNVTEVTPVDIGYTSYIEDF